LIKYLVFLTNLFCADYNQNRIKKAFEETQQFFPALIILYLFMTFLRSFNMGCFGY